MEEVEAYKDSGWGGGRGEHAGEAYKEGGRGGAGEHGRKSRGYLVTWKVGEERVGIICKVGIIHMNLDGVCEGEMRGFLLIRCYTHESILKITLLPFSAVRDTIKTSHNKKKITCVEELLQVGVFSFVSVTVSPLVTQRTKKKQNNTQKVRTEEHTKSSIPCRCMCAEYPTCVLSILCIC